MPQQPGQLQPNLPQQQQIVSGQNVNQTSPLLAQQLAGRPPVPGQHPSGVMQGQPGTGAMMQPRPTLIQTQQLPVRPQIQPGQQTIPQGSTGAVRTTSTQEAGDGPSVSSDDLEGLDSNVNNELGDLGELGDLDMGDDFDILEFTDALHDLDDMPSDDTRASKPDCTTSSATTNVASTTSSTSSSNTPSVVSSKPSMLSSAGTVSTIASVPVGATTTSIAISGTNISGKPSIVTSSATAVGMMPTGHLVSQPPPYTAAGSVTVPLRGAIPQVSIAGVMPGTSTAIIRGPPPPYPGPGLAPNATPIGAGAQTNIQTSKVINEIKKAILNISQTTIMIKVITRKPMGVLRGLIISSASPSPCI